MGAIGDDYITQQELKDYMSIDLTKFDDRISSVCGAVSREIEKYCHRQFNQASIPSARVYHPKAADLCVVDDFFTTAGLVVVTDDDNDGTFETTWVQGTDFELEPLNGVRDGVPGWPYWKIRAIGYKRFRDYRRASVQVTAQWGWAELPTLVHEAALMVAADTFQVKDSRLGIAGSDQFGTVVRLRENLVALGKLRHYVREKVLVK